VGDHRKGIVHGSNPYETLNTENGAITIINVPIDQKYLDKEFLKKVVPAHFSNSESDHKILDNPDFRARFNAKVVALYQGNECFFKKILKSLLIIIRDGFDISIFFISIFGHFWHRKFLFSSFEKLTLRNFVFRFRKFFDPSKFQFSNFRFFGGHQTHP